MTDHVDHVVDLAGDHVRRRDCQDVIVKEAAVPRLGRVDFVQALSHHAVWRRNEIL